MSTDTDQPLDPDGEITVKDERELVVQEPRTDLSTVGGGPLATMSDTEFAEAVTRMQRSVERIEMIQRSVMKPGTDYDTIEGTGKVSILKPGCELLNGIMGYHVATTSERHVEILLGATIPMIAYTGHCTITDPRTGRSWSASGTANSHERKHRYRTKKPACPHCGHEIRTSKDGSGTYCWKKTGGCGATWVKGDPVIDGQQRGQIENEDPADLDNTLCKMSEIRALKAATLLAHNASRLFTQDLAPRAAPHTPRAAPRAAPKPRVTMEVALRQLQDVMSHEITPDWLGLEIGVGKMRASRVTWADAIGERHTDATAIRQWMHTCLSAQAKELEEKKQNPSEMKNYKPWHIQCRIVLKLHHWETARNAGVEPEPEPERE